MKIRIFCILLVFLSIGTNPSRASISAVGPFTGTMSESFESFGESNLPGSIPVMSGNASVSVPVNNYIGTSTSFGLGSSGNAHPSDGTNGLYFTYTFPAINNSATITLAWNSPVSQFGGYFSAATDASGGLLHLTDPAPFTVRFFDGIGSLIDVKTFTYSHSATHDGGLDWHGWVSTSPISSISITANYAFVDGLQATSVPEPTAAAMVGLGIAAISILRQRRLFL